MSGKAVRYVVWLLLISMLAAGCASDKAKVEKFISEAREYIEQEAFEKAVIQLKNAIAIDSSSIEANTLLIKAYLKLGDAQETFKVYLRLEQLEPDNLEHKIQIASFYLLAQNRPEAERRIKEVLDKEPDNIQALYLHAGILSSKKEDIGTIEAVYHKILSIDKNQAKALHILARIYTTQKEYKKAETSLKDAVFLEPDNVTFYRSLFGLYLGLRQYDEAESVLKQLVSQRPEDAQPLILLGNYYLGRNDPDKAEAHFRKAIETDPGHVNAYMILAGHLGRQNRPQDAEIYIKKALAIEPENFAVKNAYGEFHFSNKDTEKAQVIVDEILGRRPDYVPTRSLKGKILASHRKYDEAAAIFRDLIEDEPGSATFNFLLGSVYYEKNDLNSAKPALSKALEKNPDHLQARLMMANIYFRGNDLYLAEDYTRIILKRFPDHYAANLLMGNIELANRNFDKARSIFKETVNLDPGNPAGFFRLGLLERNRKNHPAALDNFQKALALNPDLMDVFTAMISIYAADKNFDTALKKCDDQIKRKEVSPIVKAVAQNLKGNILLATQKKAAAVEMFEAAILNNPGFITPYLTLARFHTSEAETGKAVDLYLALIKNRPDQASPHSLLGTLYETQEKYDLAEAHYKKALDIDAAYIPAVNNLAFLYAERNKELNKALELARQAKDRVGKIPAVMDTLGWVYYKKELYDSAAGEFESCVEKDPENPIFRYHLGLAYNKLGKYGKAEENLKKALELQKDFKGAGEAQKVLDQL